MKKTYYGLQTKQALQNFPFPYHHTDLDLIYAISDIKQAAALANHYCTDIDKDVCDAICLVCKEIKDGLHDNQFPISALQGGAGTSINMNVNEVIASRATEILKEKGKQKTIHPNDHVNMSQSTNDVNPTALRLVVITRGKMLLKSVDLLIDEITQVSKKYSHVPKLGRTHIQDAVPITVGEEFASYATIINRNRKRIETALDSAYDMNLGGTAVGNSINASTLYIKNVYKYLEKITGIPIRLSDNLMAGTSSCGDMCHISAAVHTLCMDMSKIAKDIRILSSGPAGGIGEIILKPLQPGSSIMPGKINPIIPEAVNQLYYLVSGLNETIHKASHDGNLELGVMFPILADALITIFKMTESVTKQFAVSCISTLEINQKKCRENLERSTAYATLLTPVLGYDKVSQIVKRSIKEERTIKDIIIEENIMSEEKLKTILNSS